MKLLNITLLAGLASLAMVAFFATSTFAQQEVVVNPYLATATKAIFSSGDNAPGPTVLPVKGGVHFGFGGGYGRFHGGFFRGSYRGLGYGWYGGYPGWYGSSGSYLDTPTRSCVWNGYKYRCDDFLSGNSYYVD